jgi:hypothetical protein
MIGYPFGPGGYGGCFEAHCLRTTARTITVAATAKAEPAYFSDMVDSEEQGSTGGSEGPGVHLRNVAGFNGHDYHTDRSRKSCIRSKRVVDSGSARCFVIEDSGVPAAPPPRPRSVTRTALGIAARATSDFDWRGKSRS